MTSEPRCPLTDMIVNGCAHCRGLDDIPPHLESGGPWFWAAFKDVCSGCARDTDPGEELCGDGEGGYWGRCCA